MVLPSGFTSTVKEIWTLMAPLPEAFSPQSVTLVLEHDIDVSRGDIIVDPHDLPGASSDLHAQVCWMHPRPLQRGKKYFLKHTTQTVQAVVTAIEHRINVSTLEPEPETPELAMNDIGEIRLTHVQAARFRRLRDQPADRLVHSYRARHERNRRRRHALSTHRGRQTGVQGLRDLKRFAASPQNRRESSNDTNSRSRA